MRDEQNPDLGLVAYLRQQQAQLGGLAGVQPCRGLIETQEPRPGAHGTRNLEAALLAIGEIAGIVVREGQEGRPLEPKSGESDGPGTSTKEEGRAQKALAGEAGGRPEK